MERSFHVDQWLVEPELNSISRNGRVIHLEPKVMELCAYLAAHPGELVRKEELIRAVWPDTFVSDDALTHSLSELRKALEDDPKQPRYIETIPKRGYRLVAKVSTAVVPSKPETFRGVGRRLLVAGLVAVTVTSVLAWWALWRATPAVRSNIKSIAILPLANFSGDPEQEYFADGMTDALINELAKISSLRVISRTSAMRYKKTDKPLPQVARELDVDAVIEGAVLREGNQVRISVQLIHGPTDQHIWSQTFDRELPGILALHSEVARAIAGQVKLKLRPHEEVRLESAPPVNAQAYEAYLRGRHHWYKRTEDDFQKAIQYFQQAIDTDPKYAAAYAGIADCYNLLPLYVGIASKDALPKGKAAALKALQIDETLAAGHTALAWAELVYDWDWVSAEAEFKRALELNPSYETAHHWYGMQLVWAGKSDQGLAELQRAGELDPLSPVINRSLGVALYHARRYDMAVHQLNKTLELAPNFSRVREYLALTYVQKGMYREAVNAIEKALRSNEGHPVQLGRMGYTYAMAGQRVPARAILDQLNELAKRKYVSPLNFAFVYLGLGENDRAILWLKKAYQERAIDLFTLREPMFDPLRDDPRFQNILRNMSYPE